MSAAVGTRNLQNFTKLMQDPKNQDVFTRVEESRKQNDQGIMVWLVTQHEDWLDSTVVDEVKDLNLDEDKDDNEDGAEGRTVEVGSVLQKFREEHPSVQVSVQEKEQQLKVSSLYSRKIQSQD